MALVGGVEAGAEVEVRHDRIEGESRLLLFHELPGLLFRQGLAGCVHGQRVLGPIGRLDAISLLHRLVVPRIGGDPEGVVGLRNQGCSRRGREHEALDARLPCRGFQSVPRPRHGSRYHIVGVGVHGEDGCGVDDGRDALDCLREGVWLCHVSYSHQFEVARAVLFVEQVADPGRLLWASRGTADLVAVLEELVGDVRSNKARGARDEHS